MQRALGHSRTPRAGRHRHAAGRLIHTPTHTCSKPPVSHTPRPLTTRHSRPTEAKSSHPKERDSKAIQRGQGSGGGLRQGHEGRVSPSPRPRGRPTPKLCSRRLICSAPPRHALRPEARATARAPTPSKVEPIEVGPGLLHRVGHLVDLVLELLAGPLQQLLPLGDGGRLLRFIFSRFVFRVRGPPCPR